MTAKLQITIGQYSDKGIKTDNQDFYGAILPDEPLLSDKGICAVIADGVSGSENGKLASESVVKGFLTDYFSTPESWTVKTSGQKILTAINSWLYSKSRAYENNSHGMHTTFSCLIVKSVTAHILHVGDSRIYRLQGKTLECLTNDHRVWVSKDKNYLNRAMGIDVHLDIDYKTTGVEAGDFFILTTDGVHDFISDKDIIASILTNLTDLDKAAKEISLIALENDSHDNVTCQIIHIDSLASQDEGEAYQKLTELPFPPPLNVGYVLEGYRILSEIHASNRTQVYKAEDIKTKQQVVIKTPSVNFEDDPTYIENFQREEWIGKRLKNKNIVSVYKQNEKRQWLYFVTEYINGTTLRQWANEHPRPEIYEVREIIKQVAAGLRAFHRLEMLHQDIKPENILLDADGVVKIIDFGSTKIAGIAEITTPIERINNLGTKSYAAPEYLLGHPGTNRSDIFSLGVVCYQLLTGKLPYGEKMDKADTPRKQSALIYQKSYRYNPMIPAWIDRSINKAVHIDPAQRYELLSEFIHDLSKPNEAFMHETSIPLLERNPKLFWQGLAIIMLVTNVILLYLLNK